MKAAGCGCAIPSRELGLGGLPLAECAVTGGCGGGVRLQTGGWPGWLA
jgi:hypothetical protein